MIRHPRFIHHRITRWAIAAAAAGVPTLAFAQTNTYVGPAAGDWLTGANWSLGSVPTAAHDAVVNDAATNVTVTLAAGQTGSAGSLRIDAGDAVTLSNNSLLNLGGNLLVNGTLRFAPAASTVRLSFNGAATTISGGGVIALDQAGGGLARLSGTAAITNAATIRGGGAFENLRFVNAPGGVLENDQPISPLTLDANNASPGLFVNRGTIRALAGSTVSFVGDAGGTFDNAGGQVQANGAGAIVRLANSASISGGTYGTSGGGEVVIDAGQTGTATGFTNLGTFRVRNNSRLNVGGAIVNSGQLIVSAVVNASYLTIAADTTLSGTGTTRLDSSATANAELSGAGVLTVAAGHTILGDGYFNNARVVNNGTLIGDDSTGPNAGTYLDPFNGAGVQFTNNGTIQATANNVVTLAGDSGGGFSGTGAYRADGANAFLNLINSVTVSAGTFATTGGGGVRVPAGQTARLNVPTLGAGLTTAVLNNARLYVNGTVANDGLIDVRSGANQSYLTIETDTTFAGAGRTVLNDDPAGGNAEISGGGVLTIGSGYTLSGNGYVNNQRVINNGLILADRAAGTLYLDPNNGVGTQFVNNGTVRASAGATVTLAGDSGGVFSGAGVYRADGAGAAINMINAASVVGGTIATTGGGTVRITPSQTATLTDTVLAAGSQLTIANNARLNLNGTPTLSGALAVNAGANTSYLTINGTAQLAVGTLLLNGNAGVANAEVSGGGVLNIGAAFVVSGNGYFNNLRVNNAGSIVADRAAGSMYLDPSNVVGGTFVNTGTIRAAAGATVTLAGDSGGGFAGGGVYRADGAGALVQLINNVGVAGGTFSSTAGGTLRVPASQTASLADATIVAGSLFAIANNARLNLAGTLTNDGTLSVASGVNQSYLTLASAVTLAGNGVVRLTANPGVSNAEISGPGALTIGPGQTIAGNGLLNNARVINNGTILADQSAGSMTLDPFNGAGTQFVNDGTIRAAAGATVNLVGDSGGSFSGTGSFVADSGGTIQATSSLVGNAGPVSGGGTFRVTGSANVGFTHYRVANLEATANGVARVVAGGGDAGTSKVNAVVVTTGGRVDLADHGLVVDYNRASPAATIRGYLISGRNGGAWNGTGIGSAIANAANGLAVGYGEASAVFAAPTTFLGQPIDATSVLIRYTYAGDTTLDGVVNFTDLVRLAQNYNTMATAVWTTGDFDYDGNVGFADLVLLAQNYNNALSVGEADQLAAIGIGGFAGDFALARALVPEPASVTMIAIIAAAAARRPRR